MGNRSYSATLKSIPLAATTIEDICEINVETEQPIELIGVVITQAGDSGDSGDSNEDQIDIIISRITGSPTSGTGGTTVTPTRGNTGNMQAYGGVVEMGNTTNLTGGTEEEWYVEGDNNRVGVFYWPPPEARITIRGDETLIIKTTALHTNAHEVNATVIFAETG